MSPPQMYRQLRRMRNIDAWGGPAPRVYEYHKPVYASAHLWNQGDVVMLVEHQSKKTGGPS
jgi:hypothetical protein